MPCTMMLCLCLSSYCLAGPQVTRAGSESCLEEAELVPRRGESWPRRGTTSRGRIGRVPRRGEREASKRQSGARRARDGLEEAKLVPRGGRVA